MTAQLYQIGRQIAARELSGNKEIFDAKCKLIDLTIECRRKDAPAGLQWIMGWEARFKGQLYGIHGGASKEEVYNYFLKKSEAKPAAFLKIKNQPYYEM